VGLELLGGPVGLAVLLAGVAAGGFVNGLTGFGTALASMPFLLQVFEPVLSAQIAALIGVGGQITSIKEISNRALWRRMMPMLIGGAIGIPIGTWLLPLVPSGPFKLVVGCLLVIYAVSMLVLAGKVTIARGGAPREAVVGLSGGVLGGLAGLSGVVPTIQAALEAWPKDERRQAFRVFNFAILSGSLVSHAVAGLVTKTLLIAGVIAIPALVLSVRAGTAAYHRLDDRRFDRLVLVLLLFAGLGLIVGNLKVLG
jgi:uncharacterized protein